MRFSVGSIALTVATGASVGMVISAEACIVVPPPDLPPATARPPRILRDSVMPAEGTPLGPGPIWQFVVPVKLDGLVDSFQYEVFVDFMPPAPGRAATGLVQGPVTVSPNAPDGGVKLLPDLMPIDSQGFDLAIHHRIEVMVALSFPEPHTFDSRGGDSVSWDYPAAEYDAGAFQDGFAPVTDASDALPIAPGDP